LILITLHLDGLTCVHIHVHFHFILRLPFPVTYIIFSGGLLQFVGQKNKKLNLSCVLDLPVLTQKKYVFTPDSRKGVRIRMSAGKANLLRQLNMSHKYRKIFSLILT